MHARVCVWRGPVCMRACPAHEKMPTIAQSTVADISTSLKTTIAPLPPSSSDDGRSASALACSRWRPVAPLPVNDR